MGNRVRHTRWAEPDRWKLFCAGASAVTSIATGWLNNLSNYSAEGYTVSAWTSPAQ